MKALLVKVVLVLSSTILSESDSAAVPGSSITERLNNYDLRIQVLHNILSVECPTFSYYRKPRNRTTREIVSNIEADKIVYNKLFEELMECRRNSSAPTQSPITTEVPTTIAEGQSTPVECLTAINFTDPSRLDINGSDYRPHGPDSYDGFACDFGNGNETEWFRFTGAAGNRMLNTCPLPFSCGAYRPIWTDAEMPEVVGIPTTITAYKIYQRGECTAYRYPVIAMRCSTDTEHDLIYKLENQPTGGSCYTAFCGMM